MTELNRLVEKIFQLEILKDKPPLLIDVGASGIIHPDWEIISKHSVCIAFDADQRATDSIEKDEKDFLKKITMSKIVAENVNQDQCKDFYLTDAVYCSSSLKPNNEKLKKWEFSKLFHIKEKTRLPATTLTQTIDQVGYDYVDWLKFDTQGTDLRIYESLPLKIQKQILALDFEPGIIDAYEGEDKLFNVMTKMEKQPYWLSSMTIRGSHRINNLKKEFEPQNIYKNIATSPGWAELTYLNTLESDASKRDLLLGWLFATIMKQHGFAFELADKGMNKTNKEIFKELKYYSKNCIDFNKPVKPRWISYVTKRISNPLRKLLTYLENNTNDYKWISPEERSLVKKE